jgi:hypothetical protein
MLETKASTQRPLDLLQLVVVGVLVDSRHRLQHQVQVVLVVEWDLLANHKQQELQDKDIQVLPVMAAAVVQVELEPNLLHQGVQVVLVQSGLMV